MHHPTLLSTLAAVLAALPAAQAGMYTKSSPVLQINARSYDKLIANSNYTSIVEFYAPWCGHCQNLKPAYEKAAKNLDGLAKVAAVDCDDDANKAFCSGMGVKGFPTLKVVRPSKSGGKPVVEDYQGPRTATAIVETVVGKINNHVTRVTDKELDDFLAGDKPKAILFTEKGTTSALLRSIAIDFLDVVSVGQIRNKEKAAVEKFGIDKFPSFVLIPGPEQDPIVYDGELAKKDMIAFLSQVGEPNPDPAPAKTKKNGSDKKEKKGKSTKASKEEPAVEPEPEESPEASTADATSGDAAPSIIPISVITTEEELVKQCLNRKAHTCILAFTPSETSETGEKAVSALSQLNTKYIQGKRHMFPFFSVPGDNEAVSSLPKKLELSGDVEMVAVNARRGWWRHYQGDFSSESVESWIDTIRMGEGSKNKLPQDVVVDEAETAAESSTSTEATQATDPEPEIETEAPEPEEEDEIVHGEL